MASQKASGRRASEDTISTISLETSEDEQYSTDHEFLVECVLAEKVQDGRTLYLIDWTGYPREMSTWEPPENIQDPDILKIWEERKTLQQKGEDTLFDVDSFEAQKKEFEEAKARRSQLRHEKRKALRQVSSEDESIENDIGSVHGSEHSGGSPQSPKRHSPPRTSIGDRRTSARQSERQEAKRAKVQNHIESDSDSSDDEPLISRKPRASIQKPAPAATSLPKEASARTQNVQERRASRVDKIQQPSASGAGSKTVPDNRGFLVKGLADLTNRGGRGATRGGSSLLSKNVFAGGRTRRRKPTLIEMATDSSKSQKHFNQLRMVRRAELAGRQVADKAPDIEALPGGLFDPSKNLHVEPIRRGTLRKHSSILQEDEELLQSESPTKRQLISQEVATQSAKPKEIPWQNIPWERRTICFWWSRNIRCEHGNNCKFLHINDLSLPIASPPSGWVEAKTLPCAFYNRPGGCNKGDSCTFLHENASNNATNDTVSKTDLRNAHTRPVPSSAVEQSKICYWWFCYGRCKKGDECTFAHILDSTGTIAMPHRDAREPCLASLRGECRNSRDDCPNFHAHPSHDSKTVAPVAPVAPMAPMVPEPPLVAPNYTAASEFAPFFTTPHNDRAENSPIKLREQDVCMFWKKGQCRNSAATCRWAHRFYAETPTLNQNIQTSTRLGATGSTKPKVHFSTDLFDDPADYSMPTIENTDNVLIQPQDQSSNTVPMSNLPESDTIRPRSKQLDLDESGRKNEVGALNTRLKMVIFGADSNKQFIKVDFGELPAGSLWGNTCANLEVIRFDQICTAQDFCFKYKSPQQLWEGHLGIDLADRDGSMLIGQVAEQLRLGSTGLLALCEEVAILVHPASAEEWKYLRNTASPSSHLDLRYLVFDLDKLIASSTTPPALITAPDANQLSSKIERLIPPCKPEVVKTLYGLNYTFLRDLDHDILRPSKKPRNADNFFLIFPTSASHLADFIAAWLRSCRKECKVYNSQVDGAWDYFVHSSSISAGTILVYETVLASLSELPWTRDLTVQNSYLFWCIGDSTSSAPLSLHPKINGVPNLGQITITPLFPFGAAIFVTPSFLAAEPAMTYKLLKWFQNKIKLATPGSYKLVGCHDLRSYLLDLAVQKSRERDDLLETHHNLPAKHAMASEKGLSHEDCQLRFDVFRLFVDILENDLSSALSAIDLDPSEDSINPVRYAPCSIDPDNEKDLVTWFAGWTILNLGAFRKFYVVGSSNKNASRAVKMVPELGTATNSPQVSKTPAVSSSELSGGNPNDVQAVSPRVYKGAARPKKVTFAIPSTVGSTTRTTDFGKSSLTRPQVLQNGSSKSNDATKPSSVNQSLHSAPPPYSLVDGGKRSSSESASSLHNPSMESRITLDKDKGIKESNHPPLKLITTDVDGSSSAAGVLQTPSSANLWSGMKPLLYETTDVWYQRWRADKRGWEHICVDKWERVLSLIGVLKNPST